MLRRLPILFFLAALVISADAFAQCKLCGREGPPTYCARCDDTFYSAAGRCDFWDWQTQWGVYGMCNEVGQCTGALGDDPCRNPEQYWDCKPFQVTQRQWLSDEWRLASVQVVPRTKRRS